MVHDFRATQTDSKPRLRKANTLPQKLVLLWACCFLCLIYSKAYAASYPLPQAGNDIIGHVQIIKSQPGDNFFKLARQYDIGYYELVEANPRLNPNYIPSHTKVVIPSRYILPNVPRKGIVINIAEMRMYYFPKNKNKVYTFPIGIGRFGWSTPLGEAKTIGKSKNPTWYVPKSIREARLKDGVELPLVVPPGPDNPLGKYAIRLSFTGYLIHGTNEPNGVGRRSSSGCIRMFPEDIKLLFAMIPKNTPVRIVENPFKVGYYDKTLYMEVHQPLREQNATNVDAIRPVHEAVESAQMESKPLDVRWDDAWEVIRQQRGVPYPIGYAQTASLHKLPSFAEYSYH